MKLWHMRGPELADPADRRALLADLADELQEREPELLSLIRKMIDMTDAVEVGAAKEIRALEDQVEDLEADLASLESRLYGDTAELDEKIEHLEEDVTYWRQRYDEAQYNAHHWEAEATKLQEAQK